MTPATAREWADESDTYLPKVNEGRLRDRHGNDVEQSASDWKAEHQLYVDSAYSLHAADDPGGREGVEPWDVDPMPTRRLPAAPIGSRPSMRRLQRKAADIDEIKILEAKSDDKRRLSLADAVARRVQRKQEADREAAEREDRRRNGLLEAPRDQSSTIARPKIRLDVEDLEPSIGHEYLTDEAAIRWWTDEGTEDDDLYVGGMLDVELFDDDPDKPIEPTEESSEPAQESPAVDRPTCDHCRVRPCEKGRGDGWRHLCSACRKMKTRTSALPVDRQLGRARRKTSRDRYYEQLDADDRADRLPRALGVDQPA